MHNKKIITKGLILGAVVSATSVNSIANYDNEYNLLDINDNLNSLNKNKIKKENKVENSINQLKNEKVFNAVNTMSVNKNIVEGSILEITLTDGEFVPNLSDNPDGYETIKVTTTGNKKLVSQDYDNLRLSGIPKVDLSNAYSDSIPAGAFTSATHLTEFKFPQGITTIGGGPVHLLGAFYNCKNLTGNLVIPDSVTTIEGNAFRECTGFTGDLVIPDSVTSIGIYAFCKCSGFTGDLVIPNTVISIGGYAFRECTGFTGDLIIPDSVTSIGNYAFYDCSGFTGDLIIPNSVTSIGNYAFYDCSGFTGDLIIPDTVTTIEAYTFDGCSGFTGELIIPDSVTSIGNYAFYDCSGFTGDLIIPNSVTSIGNYAFKWCSGFTGDLIIPDSVTSIGADTFYGCVGIGKILIKVNSSDLDTNYKESIIANFPNTSQVIIDIPYDFDITGTWLETTSKTIVKPVIKNIVNGIESELIDNKGEAVSLYIPSLYQESNISVLKDDNSYTLPVKDINGKYVFTESGVYELTVITDLGNISVINFEVEEPQFKNAKEAVEKAEGSEDLIDINDARDLVNNLPECTIKDELQDRLNNIFPDLTLESKSVTANLDLYIKSENMLLLSLDTNSITFEDFSGVEDMEKQNAINLTVNSSLPYKINAYLATEIQNSDGTNIMDKDILNIRANGEADYNTFVDTTTPIVLLDDQPADNDVSHGIDIMLKGNIAHEKDIYKTTIKFEAEQK